MTHILRSGRMGEHLGCCLCCRRAYTCLCRVVRLWLLAHIFSAESATAAFSRCKGYWPFCLKRVAANWEDCVGMLSVMCQSAALLTDAASAG
jgi:hypothetical protein